MKSPKENTLPSTLEQVTETELLLYILKYFKSPNVQGQRIRTLVSFRVSDLLEELDITQLWERLETEVSRRKIGHQRSHKTIQRS